MAQMWNWRYKDWPKFTYDKALMAPLELSFIQKKGTVIGALKYVKNKSRDELLVEILSNEALKTSEIEGEYLNRDSVQSSIKKNLGFAVDRKRVPPAEFGIAELMVDLYRNYDKALSHATLYEWHKMIVNGRRDLSSIGAYRSHTDPMQVVSGRLDMPNIHFEAPPSKDVPEEMGQFVQWFNDMHQQEGAQHTLSLARAGLVHLYFVSIHPFEDGNGRIARALAEKSLALSAQQPTLISLSQTIESHKKMYYASLEKNNKTLEVTDWLMYFGQTIIDAQDNTLAQIDFLIEKAKFFDRFSAQLNTRQHKVVERIFREGTTGFTGGLSADNYTKIAKTSASTATRDLSDLVDKGVVIKKGNLKGTRYFLNIKKANQ